MRKIDIYHNEEYVCSTTQSRTCREAKERFLKNPEYMIVPHSIRLDDATNQNIKCNFAK